MAKLRLDTLLVNKGLAPSRQKARGYILAGEVTVNGRRVDKVATPVDNEAEIHIRAKPPYVSRGGLKVANALDEFRIEPVGWVAADVGASTGGFTDCLLQRGAARVYAIDVGYGQLSWTLRQDPRVVVMERTNARYLEALPESVHLVTIDASFISLRLLLPQAAKWLDPGGMVVCLIKPQFEAGRGLVGKGGVVRDKRTHRAVLRRVLKFAIDDGWVVRGLVRSPITGPKGNAEFLAWLGTPATGEPVDLKHSIDAVLSD